MQSTTIFEARAEAGGAQESGQRIAVLGFLLSGSAWAIGLGQGLVIEALRDALGAGVFSSPSVAPVARLGFVAMAATYAGLLALAVLRGTGFWFYLGAAALFRAPGAFWRTRVRRDMPSVRWRFATALMLMALAGLLVRVVSPAFAELAYYQSSHVAALGPGHASETIAPGEERP
jgi:hypothetical protein